MDSLNDNILGAMIAAAVAFGAFLSKCGKFILPQSKQNECFNRMANSLDEIKTIQTKQSEHIFQMSKDISEIKGRLS